HPFIFYMNKILVRIIALLLLPCLIADPCISAVSPCLPNQTSFVTHPSEIFEQNAINISTPFFTRPSLLQFGHRGILIVLLHAFLAISIAGNTQSNHSRVQRTGMDETEIAQTSKMPEKEKSKEETEPAPPSENDPLDVQLIHALQNFASTSAHSQRIT